MAFESEESEEIIDDLLAFEADQQRILNFVSELVGEAQNRSKVACALSDQCAQCAHQVLDGCHFTPNRKKVLVQTTRTCVEYTSNLARIFVQVGAQALSVGGFATKATEHELTSDLLKDHVPIFH